MVSCAGRGLSTRWYAYNRGVRAQSLAASRAVLALFVAVVAALAAPSARGGERPVFPLEVAASGRYLADQRGTPFLVHGDTPWSLTHNLTFEEAVRYLEDRRARGFNTLLVSAPDAYDPDGKATYPPDRYGQPAVRGRTTGPAPWRRTGRTSTAC